MAVIRTTPDMERAKSLLDMSELRLSVIRLMKQNDFEKFASKIAEEYYDALLELATALMCADGYRAKPDSAGIHIGIIEHMRTYKELAEHEVRLIDDMRKKRIGIKYYGSHIDIMYLKRKEKELEVLLVKLKRLASSKIQLKKH